VAAGSADLDQLYAYDALNELIDMQQGHLNLGTPPTISSDTLAQSWVLDAMGNMSSVTTNGMMQTRTQDTANETTAASGWATPVYDRVGNMTTTPNPNNPANGLHCQ